MNIIEVICVNYAQDELQVNQTLIENKSEKRKKKVLLKE